MGGFQTRGEEIERDGRIRKPSQTQGGEEMTEKKVTSWNKPRPGGGT